MTIKKLYLFRHGETNWNRDNLIQGVSDIPLNETGFGQARELAEALVGKGLQVLISSDSIRAQQTAGVIAEEYGLKVFPTPHLRETHFGVSEGMKRAEAKEKYAHILKRIDDPNDPERHDVCIPGGETRRTVVTRATGFITKFLCEQDYDCIGVSTHGGVMNGLCVVLLNEVRTFKNCEFLALLFDTETQTYSKGT